MPNKITPVRSFSETEKRWRWDIAVNLTLFICILIFKITFILLCYSWRLPLLERRKRKSHQRPVPMRPLRHQLQWSLLLSTLLAAFHRSEKTVWLAGVRQSRFFMCRDLVGHTHNILSLEFSTDGSFIVSGGCDNTVRLWSLSSNDATEKTKSTTSVHQMKTKHESTVYCVVISSDSSRIFSGGLDSKLFVHGAST